MRQRVTTFMRGSLLWAAAGFTAATSWAGAAQEGAMASHCSAFLPGGDGCLGPGFNTPASGPKLPFAWWQQSPAQARERLQALLAVAPAGCLRNEAALRATLAEPASQDSPAHPPLPQIAELAECGALHRLLLQRKPD